MLCARRGGGPSRVVHRIALFDNSGRITNIISQSDIIRCVQYSLVRLHCVALCCVT